MNGMGLHDIAQIGGALFDARQTGTPGDGAADGAFGLALKQSADAQRSSGDKRMTDAYAGSGRFSVGGATRSDSASGSSLGPMSAADRLAQYLSMPLSKQVFYMVLARLGISPEEYDAMPPEEQAKVAEKVAQRLKENAEAQVKAAQSGVAKSEESFAASL